MYGLDERLLSCCVLSRCDVADIVRFGAASSRCLSASRLAFSSVNSVNFNPTSARHFFTSRESLRVIVSRCGGTLRSLSFTATFRCRSEICCPRCAAAEGAQTSRSSRLSWATH